MSYCIRCYQYKHISEMKSVKTCLLCAEKRRKHYKVNRDIILNKARIYYIDNRAEKINCQKQYYQNNKKSRKNYNKQYYQEHKEDIIKQITEKAKERRKNDPIFKLRKRISGDIWKMLKHNGGTKNASILKFISYSIKDLKEHLEKQFEPWMTWQNWGSYNKDSWDDNNSSTWVWNIDHIIPHHNFKYTSMEDQSFKDCWALSNLRPLSAKINLQKNGRLI